MRRLLLTSVFLSAVLLFSACGHESENREPANTQPEQPELSFTIVYTRELQSIDPHFAESPAGRHLAGALFEGLVGTGPDGSSIVPGLAKRWEQSGDGNSWTFYLRRQDWTDGTPVTAQTMREAWLRLIDPRTNSPYAWLPAEFIQGAAEYNAGTAGPEAVKIEALDDYTLRVACTTTRYSFLKLCAHPALAAVPVHVIQEHGNSWTELSNIVSNGAFTLSSTLSGGPDTCILLKNTEYWDRDSVAVSEVRSMCIPDAAEAASRYTKGAADWVCGGFQGMYSGIEEHDGLHISPAPATYYYIFNTEKPPLDDVRVRAALSLAIDKSALPAFPAAGLVPPLRNYPVQEEAAPPGNFDFNRAAAQESLADAGFPGGKGFPRIEILFNDTEENKKVAEVVRQQWAEHLGINCITVEKDWKSYLAYRRAGAFQIVRAGWKSKFADPEPFLSMFVSGDPYNCGRYANPEYNQLIEQASRLSGPRRLSRFAEAEQILIGEDRAVLPLFYYSNVNFINTEKWGGWDENLMDYHPLKELYLQK